MLHLPLPTEHERHSRRSFLQAGALGVGGLTFADLLRARSAAGANKVGSKSQGTNVILVWCSGGPGHMEINDVAARSKPCTNAIGTNE